MKMPFSAANHTFRLPKVSSSLALSLPLNTTTVVLGSLLSAAMLLYTVGFTLVIACTHKTSLWHSNCESGESQVAALFDGSRCRLWSGQATMNTALAFAGCC